MVVSPRCLERGPTSTPLHHQCEGRPPSLGRLGARYPIYESSSLHELLARDSLQVLVIDLLALVLGPVHLVDQADGLADIARAFFGIERAVGGEHDLLQ